MESVLTDIEASSIAQTVIFSLHISINSSLTNNIGLTACHQHSISSHSLVLTSTLRKPIGIMGSF
jgi:hypothetical protein